MTEGSPFWRFSLATYARERVPEACLELQDQCGVDVNVLLYVLWLASHKRRVDLADVEQIDGFVTLWRIEVVTTLRRARRFLREATEGFDVGATARLRTDVKRVELEAERLQQEALYARNRPDDFRAADSPEDAAAGNLEAYERFLNVKFPAAACETVLRAAHSSSMSGPRP